jgi:tRNA threonylcarbamoyladenosine biosynthesis protein TsaB
VNILAFDACFGGCSVAILRDSACVAAHAVPPAPGKADLLVQLIAETLDMARLTVAAIDLIAVTTGPGGFTGVRVGVAAARALTLATGKPVVGTTSLHVMAAEALTGAADVMAGHRIQDLIVAVDAHRGELYVQSFDCAGNSTGAPHAEASDDATWLPADRRCLIVGSGAALLAEAAHRRGIHAQVGLPTLLPSAQYLGVLAMRLSPVAIVSPLYLRAPDAKPSLQSPLQPTMPTLPARA